MAESIESLGLPREVAHHLGYYVYLYVDPRTDRPFYVGKGVGERILSHLSEAGESRKHRMIAELRAEGLAPRLEVLTHALPNEETAFRIEAAVIDLFGLDDLTNAVRGWRSVQLGRLPLSELMFYYAAKPIEVVHPSLLIRINRLYRHGMSALELYEATRGIWKLGPRREGARYAMAVFEGVVREVYEIGSWHPAGSTPYTTRDNAELAERSERWEFVGGVVDEETRSRYIGASVASYFRRGQQSPITYVNC